MHPPCRSIQPSATTASQRRRTPGRNEHSASRAAVTQRPRHLCHERLDRDLPAQPEEWRTRPADRLNRLHRRHRRPSVCECPCTAWPRCRRCESRSHQRVRGFVRGRRDPGVRPRSVERHAEAARRQRGLHRGAAGRRVRSATAASAGSWRCGRRRGQPRRPGRVYDLGALQQRRDLRSQREHRGARTARRHHWPRDLRARGRVLAWPDPKGSGRADHLARRRQRVRGGRAAPTGGSCCSPARASTTVSPATSVTLETVKRSPRNESRCERWRYRLPRPDVPPAGTGDNSWEHTGESRP